MLRCHVIWAVFCRNVAAYFSGVLGYLFIVVFVLAMASYAYTPEFFANNVATLDQLNEVFPWLLLFIVPAITMSAWADEKKLGTEELLFTLPVSDVEILLGKYFSVLAVYSIALVFSLGQLFVLGLYADPDWGLLFATYVGYWLAGAALVSAGMFASSLTSSSTVAFVLGVILCAIPVFMREIVQMFAVVDGVAVWLLSFDNAIVKWFGGGVRHVFDFIASLEFGQLSLSEQFREFGLGMVPLSGLIYFGSLTAFMLYMNHVVITKRHWSANQKTGMGLQYVFRTACLIVILTSANVMTRVSADAMGLRADVTADNAYTLTDTTRDLLAAVDEKQPVTIQAFLSDSVPQEFIPVRKRLEGLLQQYSRLGGKNVEVRIVSVGDAYSRAAEEAGTLGIAKRQIQSERDGRFELTEFYLGAVISSPNDEVVISAFDVDTPLEYELTRSVRTVSGKNRRTVGVLATDASVIGGFDRSSFRSLPPWQIVSELRKQYDVAGISPDLPYDEQPELELFRLKAKHVTGLDKGDLNEEIRKAYAGKNVELATGAAVKVVKAGSKWRVSDDANSHSSTIVLQGEDLIGFGSFDVLLAVLPSSLSQPQMARFVDAIEAGTPTMIFDDPMPVTVGLQHAPMVPKRPPGGPMGQQGPPPTPRADGGKATSLMKALGIMWDSSISKPWSGELVVVFDYFNPHPKIERLIPPEFVFISPESGVPSAISQKSKITKGFTQMLALFPGRFMQVGNDTDLEFEPLLRTGANSGVLKWSEMMEEGNPFAGPQPKRDPVRIRDEDAHTLAAHIHSKKKDGLNVVYVSDIDIVSDYCLYSLSDILRRGFDYELELDNVDFVLNSVDLLAGDEAMIDLRNREAKMRPLTEIQEQVNGFRKQRQQEEERRQKQWKEEIETIQSQLDEAQNNLGSDDSGLAIQRLFTAAENATQRLKQKKEEIEQEKQQALDRLKGEERRQVESLQTRIRWWAILLPPIPPIMLGVLMLGIRAYREESTIQPSRSVRR